MYQVTGSFKVSEIANFQGPLVLWLPAYLPVFSTF